MHSVPYTIYLSKLNLLKVLLYFILGLKSENNVRVLKYISKIYICGISIFTSQFPIQFIGENFLFLGIESRKCCKYF